MRIHGLFSDSANWDQSRALLVQVMARFGDREFFAPPIFPEEFGANLFQPLGFSPEPISQFLMRRDF